MLENKVYEDDKKIAKLLIARNEKVTRDYYYIKCYPLFKSIFDNYATDCDSVKEFMDEIYMQVLVPGKSGKCQMDNFRGESTLMTWLKTSCLYYCYKKYKKLKRLPKYEPININSDDDISDETDILESKFGSIEMDMTNLNRQDVETILKDMPNKRYSKLIELKYVEQKTHNETAQILGMTMKNYYNKHKLAKEMYEKISRKEERYEK